MKKNIKEILLYSIPLGVIIMMMLYVKPVNGSVGTIIPIVLIYVFIIFVIKTKNNYFNLQIIHKHRYWIVCVIFIVLVTFKFHGSSISMWDQYYKDTGKSETKTIYMGEARPIRTDEWLVQTPLYLSQKTGNNFLPRLNKNIQSNGQDMVLAAFSPVLDPTIIAKPFNWGFLFLDKERAFSWFWFSRLLCLFMLSYELCLVLSKKNKEVSLLGAFLITLSPACQWWFSTSVVDLIIFAQGLVVSTYRFLQANSKRIKLLLAIMFTICGSGFVLCFYPPIQVSIGYLILIMLVYFVLKNRKKISKNDILYFIISVIAILLIIGYFIYSAKDSLKIMLNTVYPGQRIELGGNVNIEQIFYYLFGWLLPYKDVTFSNSCEVSSFISFFPLPIILFFFRKKDDVDNRLIELIFLYLLIQILFLFVPFPKFLAQITLFSFIPVERMLLAIGYTCILLVVMLIPGLYEKKDIKNKSLFITIISISIIILIIIKSSVISSYMAKGGVILTVISLGIMMYFLSRGDIQKLLPFAITFMLVTGFSVNPLARTLAPIYEKEVSRAINSINNESPGTWIALDGSRGGNFLYANGVKSINGVHYYPDLALWSELDKDRVYSDVYNRYAHVSIELIKDETSFELISPDAIKVNLSIKDLEKIGVRYVLAQHNLDKYNEKSKMFEKIYYNQIDNVYIYEFIG